MPGRFVETIKDVYLYKDVWRSDVGARACIRQYTPCLVVSCLSTMFYADLIYVLCHGQFGWALSTDFEVIT